MVKTLPREIVMICVQYVEMEEIWFFAMDALGPFMQVDESPLNF